MHLGIIHNQKQLHALILNYLIVLLKLMITKLKKTIVFIFIKYKDHNNKVLLLDNKLEIEIQVKAL